eukprot:6729734-Prymnesium_polylepis.1
MRLASQLRLLRMVRRRAILGRPALLPRLRVANGHHHDVLRNTLRARHLDLPGRRIAHGLDHVL